MRKKTAVHPLALPTLAALTPSRYAIKIIDEEIETADYDRLNPGLVGITGIISNINRGYELADYFGKRGIMVVMGGPYVSFNIEQTLEHARSVIIGEAEGIWDRFLDDYERGSPAATYKAARYTDFKKSVRPRWDLVDTRRIMALGVQVSRGCPNRCDFCLVRYLSGPRQRYREIDDVVEEIAGLPGRQLSFADDNLTADKEYARELMRRLIPLKVSWVCQAGIDVAWDDELLALMAAAGCTSILVGFESVDQENLDNARKPQNRVREYERAIGNIQDKGIHVIGSFIAGFDNDTPVVFDRIRRFTYANSLSYVMLNALSAYPGSDLYARMKKQGRVCVSDPEQLNGVCPTLQYNLMSRKELFERYYATIQQIYDYREIRSKAMKVFSRGTFLRFPSAGITISDKIVTTAFLIREYLCSPVSDKRNLLLDLFRLVRRGKMHSGVAVQFLLFIASFKGYLNYIRMHQDHILKVIGNEDRGPFSKN